MSQSQPYGPPPGSGYPQGSAPRSAPQPGAPQQGSQPYNGQYPNYVPQQRVYDQSRYAPTVTQAMRVQAPVTRYQGGPVQAGWATQAWNTQNLRRPVTDPTKAGADTARLVIGICAVVFLGVGLLVILLIAGLSLRGAAFFVVVLSAIPLAVIITMVWWFDRWKSRPKLLLALCVLWGAVAAVVGVLVFQTVGVVVAGVAGVDLSGDKVGAVVLAPLFEESFKGVFLVAVVLSARKYFEGPLDGWVYGSLIGAGFAFTENLIYLGQSFAENSAVGLAVTFLMRCLMSPLLHSTFVMCAGIGIGWAARRGQWWLCLVMWLPGMVCGMVLHGTWNGATGLTEDVDNALLALGLMVLVSVLISSLWFGMGLYLRGEEAKNTRHALGDYANAGWLTHEEVTMLGTWPGRRAGRAWARRYPGGIERMNAMITLSTELAGIRVRLLAGVGGQREPEVQAAKLRQFASERRQLMETAQATEQQAQYQAQQAAHYRAQQYAVQQARYQAQYRTNNQAQQQAQWHAQQQAHAQQQPYAQQQSHYPQPAQPGVYPQPQQAAGQWPQQPVPLQGRQAAPAQYPDRPE